MSSADYCHFSLAQWLEHIQKQHWRTMDLTLDRVRNVWEKLGKPSAEVNFVFAGTNGKGSSICMMEGILKANNIHTGAFTSPHLVRFNERIRIDGREASDGEIKQALGEIEQARLDGPEPVPLTYFEYNTLCALKLFSVHRVQIGLLEVGMGGRLDATRIVPNDLTLITSVGLDHEQWLGPDRESIGAEKAGIIEPGGIAVFSGLDMPASIERVAEDKAATLICLGRDYFLEGHSERLNWLGNSDKFPEEWRKINGLKSTLPGWHQVQNLGGVVAGLALTAPHTGLLPESLNSGLKDCRIPGRCQVIQPATRSQPEIIIDVAHNPDSSRELANFLSNRPAKGPMVVVMGVLADKNLDQIAGLFLDQVDHWYLATLTGERGQSANQLGKKLESLRQGISWSSHDSAVKAYREALDASRPGDRLVIFGSFYAVGDIIGYLDEQQ